MTFTMVQPFAFIFSNASFNRSFVTGSDTHGSVLLNPPKYPDRENFKDKATVHKSLRQEKLCTAVVYGHTFTDSLQKMLS